jgi:3-methylcrotonyl-CoA carboxylase alpha subunit
VWLEDPSRTLHQVLVRASGNAWHVQVGERSFGFAAQLDGERLDVEHAGRSEFHRFLRVHDAGAERVWLCGPQGTHSWTRVDRVRHALAGGDAAGADAGNRLRAPMPGLVTSVPVGVGASVRAGDPLVMLEAMKMLHTLTAPVDGCVTELRCREGDSVRGGDVLVVIEPEEKA